MNGKTGGEIPEVFRKIYEDLFNKVNDNDEMKEVLEKVNNSIDNTLDKDKLKMINMQNVGQL